MHCGRGYTAGCVGSSNSLFVVGGTHLAHLQPGIEVYDFKADRWRHYGVNSPHPTTPHAMDNDANGEEEEDNEDIGEIDEIVNSVLSRSTTSVSNVTDYFLRGSHQVLYMM